jgi:hypothetical protein
MDYLHRGSPCYWVVILRSAQRLLESHLRRVWLDMYTGDFTSAPCSQFVHHQQLWVPLQKLRRWCITFTVVRQEPGDVMVFMPGACYQGWATGAMVSERAYYGDALSPLRSVGYDSCHWGCHKNAACWDARRNRMRRKPEQGNERLLYWPILLGGDNDSDADSDTDSDANSNADSNTDSNANSNANSAAAAAA